MSRKLQLSKQQMEQMEDAYWTTEDRPHFRVPDTYAARLAYERESLSHQVLSAVKEFRDSRGLTQQQLALELGVSEGRVSQVLSGDQNLTLKTLASLAAALKGHFEIKLVNAAGGRWECPDSPTSAFRAQRTAPASAASLSEPHIAQGA